VTSRPFSFGRRASRGVSLIELMVGVAIGLIGVVAIFQAVSVWTKHTQTTSSGGDAQVAGTLALFNIERDLKLAGHGFGRAASAVMGCNVQTTIPGVVNMRPVQIAASGPAGSPDTISVFYGDSSFYVEEGNFTGSTATTKRLRRLGGYRNGDVAIVAGPVAASGPAACMMIEITNDADPTGWVSHDPAAAYVSFYTASAAVARFNSASAPPFGAGTIYNLGPTPRFDVWAITNNRVLSVVDLLGGGPAAQIAEGVVNLKAEYGYDNDNDGRITNNEWFTPALLPAGPDWKRVLAIRVAVLVRSRQFERNGDPAASGTAAVTPTALNPLYFGTTGPAKNFLMTNIDGQPDGFTDADADPNNWRYYRYRVYERVIPLKNMLWGTWG
jgi:type IV pilus assembly protein PilW